MILKNLQETEEVSYGEYILRKIYNESTNRNFVFTPHWHELCEMVYIISGYLDITFGSKAARMKAGDFAFFAKDELHSGISGVDGCVYYAVQYKWSDIFNFSTSEKNLYNAICDGVYTIKSPINDATVGKLFENILNVCESKNISRPFAERAAICELLTYLFDNYLVEKLAVLKTDEKFNKILQYINNNYCQPITSDIIAKKFSYNKSYFCRLFKQHMRLSPTDYINLCRIRHAQTLIKENELNLSEIAAKCGYNSNTYFSVTFKKIIGKTPKEWKTNFFKNN